MPDELGAFAEAARAREGQLVQRLATSVALDRSFEEILRGARQNNLQSRGRMDALEAEIRRFVADAAADSQQRASRVQALTGRYPLGGVKRGEGPNQPVPVGNEPVNKYEQALRDAGLLDGPSPSPTKIQEATLMTYILNAGTDYGTAPGTKDFAETPYSAADVQRIANRQSANEWSYTGAWAIESTGGSLVTTPNGMLMGLGGRVQDTLSCQGGTTYGDLFMVNIDHSADPAGRLRKIVQLGNAWYDGPNGPYQGDLDLDRVLHHEVRHSQQWARLGPVAFGNIYLAEEARVRLFGGTNRFEKDAGLHDGGYE